MMRVIFHPSVHSDVAEIIEYYEEAGVPDLADEFYQEFLHYVKAAGSSPNSFSIRYGDIRQVNLTRFPYQFLYRLTDSSVLVLVVRHHRRDPTFGMNRR